MTPHTKKKAPAKGAGKKGVPARKPRRASPKKKAALFLEVGKTYLTRNGKFRAKIVCIGNGAWPYKGEWLGREPSKRYDPRSPSWMLSGSIYLGEPEALDLVREVPSAKRGGAKRSRPKSPSHPPKSKRGEA